MQEVIKYPAGGLSSLLTNPTYEVPTLNPKPRPKPQKVGKIIAQDP